MASAHATAARAARHLSSPAALRMVGIAAARRSFEGSSALLRELAGLASRRRRWNAMPKRSVRSPATNADHRIGALRCLHRVDRSRRHRRARRNTEVQGRGGKQPDGSAKTREAKTVVVGAEHRPRRTPRARPGVCHLQRRDRDHRHPRYRHRACAVRPTHPARGPTSRLRHCRAPGHPRRRRAVDLELCRRALLRRHPDRRHLHAKGHVFELAKAIYGVGSEIGERWAKKRREELDEGRVDDVIAALRSHGETCSRPARTSSTSAPTASA